jgi:hypothetical protein
MAAVTRSIGLPGFAEEILSYRLLKVNEDIHLLADMDRRLPLFEFINDFQHASVLPFSAVTSKRRLHNNQRLNE